MKQAMLVLLGAAAGGALGVLGFYFLLTQGFYAIMLPGALAGFGAGAFRCRYLWPSIVTGLLALVLGFLAEFWFRPWAKDQSLLFFIQNLHQHNIVTLGMIALGMAVGFWCPYAQYRRERGDAAAREILTRQSPTQPPPS